MKRVANTAMHIATGNKPVVTKNRKTDVFATVGFAISF